MVTVRNSLEDPPRAGPRTMNPIVPVLAAGLLTGVVTTGLTQDPAPKQAEPVQLGNFSVSLTVKNLEVASLLSTGRRSQDFR